ncbi:hypothetical protein Hanom_Chr10g00875951 [Helianthus anomalus]
MSKIKKCSYKETCQTGRKIRLLIRTSKIVHKKIFWVNPTHYQTIPAHPFATSNTFLFSHTSFPHSVLSS